jgi:hypothetical protein
VGDRLRLGRDLGLSDEQNMEDPTQERWCRPCLLAAVENDPAMLLALIPEVNYSPRRVKESLLDSYRTLIVDAVLAA